MRISDWSSDVCSSDLFPRSGSSRNSGFGVEQGFRDADRNVAVGKYFLPFQFHRTETNEIVACASIGSQCVQSFSGGRVHVDHGTALLPRARRFHVTANPPAVVLVVGLAEKRIEIDAPRCDFRRIDIGDPDVIAPVTNRSEEHTYVLQSLMRISYAVLCLQQKKT